MGSVSEGVNMPKRLNIEGEKYGKLTAISIHRLGGRRSAWECRCDCGNKRIVDAGTLRYGLIKECIECVNIGRVNLCKSRSKHGIAGTGVYSSWKNMRNRCLNPQHRQYKRYGALGRIPCNFILESALNLKSLIGEKPNGKTLERINNSLGYTCGSCAHCRIKGWPLNVKWATPKEQAQNRSPYKSIHERKWPRSFTHRP